MTSLQPFFRRLGSTELMVSPLGLGTVKFGRNQGVKYPASFELPDDRQAKDILALAHDLGINLLDTAPAYGISEERLGGLLGSSRHDWVICTKVGEEFENGQSHFDFSAAHTRMSIERSLRRLKTDYLDLVLVHSDGNDIGVLGEAVYSTLAELKRAGLIRAFGFSGKTIDGGIRGLDEGDCAMVTYNLQDQQEKPVLDHALSHNKGILIKKALASGHVCLNGEDPMFASLQLIYSHPAVASAVIGTINPTHLRENVATALRVLHR
ncbi:aldo/keto reductase [uncultured Halopseudomonas sp.]|jgi:aryl-alcohol dehydrogenase-like predicted oxidoreductase|uniref:aldo/keto reductase n=1 Tax=uncultured Halopseudomonas sp. TaxID=2901193 RepID=UPI0030EC35B6|tara:strand:- start:74110 stop:74907 length:798 start_codon:yes stop_codon:yes gene_type:complete